MAITNYDGIISARTGGGADDRMFYKAAAASPVAANWVCFVKAAGNPSSAAYAAATSGGANLNSSDPGAIQLTAASAATAGKYLLTFAAGGIAGVEIGVVGLLDVLWAGAGIQMGSSATQAINATPVRSTSGVYNKLGVMVSTALTTACTVTVWYTDSGGTATSVDVVISTGGGQGRMLPAAQLYPNIPNGIKSIQSCQVQTAQTVGAVDLMIFKPLDFIPAVTSYTWVERDMTAQIDGIMALDTDSSGVPGCVVLAAMHSGTTGRAITGMIRTVRG